MTTFVEIAVNVPQVRGVFHYHLPPEMEGRVAIGHLVAVPFGRQTVQGVVLGFVDQPALAETRPVLELIDAQAVLTVQQLALARILAEETLSPLAACIDLMLPAGLAQRTEAVYAIQGDDPGDLTGVAQRLWRLLQRRGALRAGQIERSMPRLDWQASAERLVRRGLLSRQSVLPPPRVRPKYLRSAQLACAPEEALARLSQIRHRDAVVLDRRLAILRFLAGEPGPVDVTWVYAASGGNLRDLQFLSEHDLIVLGESEVWRDPLRELDFQPSQPPALTQDQVQVWSAVQAQLQAARGGKASQPLLLHGVTGSGKTEIYLRAVAETLQSGRQAIVLVPEIALTPQTVRRFAGRFPGLVGLVHSGLSEGERYDTWRRARLGLLKVVVGPRSALFTPFPDPGLIVIDECHDDSYYQTEVSPYYDARQAAVAYARLAGAACLFGSATPDVSHIELCRKGQWRYLRLPARILAHRQVIQAHLERLGASASNYRPFEGEAETTDLPRPDAPPGIVFFVG